MALKFLWLKPLKVSATNFFRFKTHNHMKHHLKSFRRLQGTRNLLLKTFPIIIFLKMLKFFKKKKFRILCSKISTAVFLFF